MLVSESIEDLMDHCSMGKGVKNSRPALQFGISMAQSLCTPLMRLAGLQAQPTEGADLTWPGRRCLK